MIVEIKLQVEFVYFLFNLKYSRALLPFTLLSVAETQHPGWRARGATEKWGGAETAMAHALIRNPRILLGLRPCMPWTWRVRPRFRLHWTRSMDSEHWRSSRPKLYCRFLLMLANQRAEKAWDKQNPMDRRSCCVGSLDPLFMGLHSLWRWLALVYRDHWAESRPRPFSEPLSLVFLFIFFFVLFWK